MISKLLKPILVELILRQIGANIKIWCKEEG
jgi:hypothetical protein